MARQPKNDRGLVAPRRGLLLCACAFVALATSPAVAAPLHDSTPAVAARDRFGRSDALVPAVPQVDGSFSTFPVAGSAPGSPTAVIEKSGVATGGGAHPRAAGTASRQLVKNEGAFDIVVELPTDSTPLQPDEAPPAQALPATAHSPSIGWRNRIRRAFW